MNLKALAIAIAVTACGEDPDNKPKGDPVADLSAKRDLYMALLPSVSDPDGFVEWNKCDSVHWSALTGAVSRPVNMAAVIDAEGRLHRRPQSHGECYPEHSASLNSKDAYLMVLAYGVQYGDTAMLEVLYEAVARNKWVSGPGPLSRTYWTLNLRSLYAQAIDHLGGKKYANRLLEPDYPEGATGYEANLQVVGILTYGKFRGAITDQMKARLSEHHQRQPRNPLFAAAYYRYSGEEAARDAAISSLKDEQLFPADRLPTSSDRCEPWLVQRDAEGDGWQPCLDQKTHSGGDFLFSEGVLSGRF